MQPVNKNQATRNVNAKNASVAATVNRSGLPKVAPTGTRTYTPPGVTPVSNTIPKNSGIPSSKG